MKIAVIGASGKAGSRILKEALDRGHEVTAIVRDRAKVTENGVSIVEKDILSLTAADLNGYEVVVNAFAAPMGQEQLHVEAGQVLIQALKGTSTRLIVVGGAGSLYADEAQTILVKDTPGFPDFVFPTADNQSKNLNDLKSSANLSWTFISPSAEFALGQRTGSYQLGKDNLLVNSQGKSYVSYEDYAVAVVDEIEKPQHVNTRFTVVSEG
ncbi:NAD(P)-dependent oxidoreductase [Paenibacillus massiliensis]|uniref:NAD(P)-dependent oxidoreductase n=1 Tax=Paenibacillus massiliensis TaxID=225917 RepID=UPI000470F1DB|nr:NAD(P)-dependent oxidoreductase [Paenibacillus massiliensis]